MLCGWPLSRGYLVGMRFSGHCRCTEEAVSEGLTVWCLLWLVTNTAPNPSPYNPWGESPQCRFDLIKSTWLWPSLESSYICCKISPVGGFPLDSIIKVDSLHYICRIPSKKSIPFITHASGSLHYICRIPYILIRYRYTKECHSRTIKTITLPKLAH